MDTKKFTGREGQLISTRQVLEYTEPHLKKERDTLGRGENFVKAEFFGIHTFNELIGLHGDRCVGFRVYYGVGDHDDLLGDGNQDTISKKPTSRLFIVAVDENGRDLTSTQLGGGMKDMPAEKDAMSGGPLCPSHC